MITLFTYFLYFSYILLRVTVFYIVEAVIAACKSNRKIVNVKKRYTPLVLWEQELVHLFVLKQVKFQFANCIKSTRVSPSNISRTQYHSVSVAY